MEVPYYQINAFISPNRPFSGNPAGVCPLPFPLPDALLQSIAKENNLSETAFLLKQDDHYRLRWFTPSVEVDLCGHATLASAHVLFHHLNHPLSEIHFQTQSGRLTVTRNRDLITLDFPSMPASPCPPPVELVKGLGATPGFTAKARDYLAVFENEETVRELRPDMESLSQLDSLGVIATAPGKYCDFVSRFFAPRAGICEDPVTGSAHCTLVPYWSERLRISPLHALQVSQREGELFCVDRKTRVLISGKARTHFSGHLDLLL